MDDNDPHLLLDSVQTRDDLAAFAEALRLDLVANPDRWENRALVHYLDSLSAVLVDNGPEAFQSVDDSGSLQPSWHSFARLLLAASAYE